MHSAVVSKPGSPTSCGECFELGTSLLSTGVILNSFDTASRTLITRFHRVLTASWTSVTFARRSVTPCLKQIVDLFQLQLYEFV